MLEPGLYVVATPIGRLSDITLTAIEVLKTVDLILCEDTRIVARLLQHYQIAAKCLPLHKFNEANSCNKVIDKLVAGAKIALVSDAGTPAIHDPGARLVQLAHEHAIAVKAIPGPSAVIAALSVAGSVADDFYFQGFLPTKTAMLCNTMSSINQNPGAVICFESTHRIKKTLDTIAQVIEKERSIVLCKELTKVYETTKVIKVSEIPELLQMPDVFFKGEWVLVFKPYQMKSLMITAQEQKLLEQLLPVCGVKQAVAITKSTFNGQKKYLYEYAVQASAKR